MQEYRVSQVLEDVKRGLNALGELAVRGEISNWKVASSGHCYFKLKDLDGSVLEAIIFRSTYRIISKSGDYNLGDEKEVVCYGYLDIYPPQGRLRLVVQEVRELGVGLLAKEFFLLKEKLEREGLFDSDRKKAIPDFPKKIGLIASSTGAAVRDVLETIRRRYPLCTVVLAPSKVQGVGAVSELVAALDQLQKIPDLDVIIIARGGGSAEDLWAFNEEPLARAIASSRVPVITGIGHQTDLTIADLVADLSAPTPTAAANAATPDRNQLLAEIEQKTRRLNLQLSLIVEELGSRLHELLRRLNSPLLRIEQLNSRLKFSAEKLHRLLDRKLESLETELRRSTSELNRLEPALQLNSLSLRNLELSGRLHRAMHFQLERKRTELKEKSKYLVSAIQSLETSIILKLSHLEVSLQSLRQRLSDLSPLGVLDRGYSLIFRASDGKVVKDIQELKGEIERDGTFIVRMRDGTLSVKMEIKR